MTDPKPATPATDEEIAVFRGYMSKGPWLAARLVNQDGSAMSMDDIVTYVSETVVRGGLDFFTVSCHHPDGGRADVCHAGNGPTSAANAKAIEAVPNLLSRIAADAETIKAERSRADKYEAESEQKGADLMAAEAVIEDLKAAAALADAIIEDNDTTRTIRDLRETVRKQAEEIERLKGREKVRAFAKLHDPTECHDYDCDRCHT